MAQKYYKDPITGQTILVGNPELNPQLTARKTEVADYQGTPINSDVLQPQNLINFKNPNVNYFTPDISKIDTGTSQQILPQEQQQSDLMKSTQALINQYTGRAGEQATQETAAGIPELQKTQTDLSSQLKAIQNEAQAIPLQLQQEATARGITTGGLAPLQTARLRTNAIQALGISSLLEASKGNLATAQAQADRAVAAKFDPLKAQIDANLQNLDLLSKDPTLTVAQKNRLELQRIAQENQKAQIDQQEQEANNKYKIGIEAASLGADAVTLQKIQNAPNAIEAKRIQTEAGFGIQVEDKVLSVAEAKSLGVPYGTTESQARAMGITPGDKTGEAEPISPYQEERAYRTVQSVDELSNLAKKNPQIFGRTAALPLPNFARSDAFRNFKNELDTLKSSIAFGELTAMREASKTGGALGQVSDREGKLLESALGALDMSQSPENFVKQLQKVKDSINRWRTTMGAEPIKTMATEEKLTSPDGKSFVNISDLTEEQIQEAKTAGWQ